MGAGDEAISNEPKIKILAPATQLIVHRCSMPELFTEQK